MSFYVWLAYLHRTRFVADSYLTSFHLRLVRVWLSNYIIHTVHYLSFFLITNQMHWLFKFILL